MKKFLKSAGLPIGVFALAIGSAFATNAMKSSNLFATEQGYQKLDSDGLSCVPQIDCSTIQGPACTWKDAQNITHNLFGMQEVAGQTVCTKVLYRAR
ncbi:MAG: DUF6520 family protein [Flavobacteriaceae bacterium]|jgi:hypothetical protein|nr:DUF6520 family protein [Flavobacteriaceae bacterium]